MFRGAWHLPNQSSCLNQNVTQHFMFQHCQPMKNHHTEQLQEEIEKYIQKKWQGNRLQSILWIHKYPCAQRISSEYCEKNVASFICWSPVTWCLHKSCRLIILIHQPFYTTGLGSAPQSGPWLASRHHINPDRWYCDTCDLYSRRVARHSSKSPSLSLSLSLARLPPANICGLDIEMWSAGSRAAPGVGTLERAARARVFK